MGKPSGMAGKHLSDETKKKLSDLNKGEKNHFYGRHHTEETKKMLSEKKKGKPNEKLKGHIVTDKTRAKISLAVTGKPAHNRKAVLQYTLDGEFVRKFKSIAEAAVELSGKIDSHINDVCNGKRSQWYGYT